MMSFFAFATLVLCASQTIALGASDTNVNADVLRSLVEAMNNRDGEKAASLFTDDAIVRMSCVPGECKVQGILSIREMIDDELRALTDNRSVIDKLLCDQSSCMMLFRVSATHSGWFHGLRPFGARLENVQVMVWTRMENGKVQEMRKVHDVHGVMEVLSPRTQIQRLMVSAWKLGNIMNGDRKIESLREIMSEEYSGTCPLSSRNPFDLDMLIRDTLEWRNSFPDLTKSWKLSGGSTSNEVICQWKMKGTFKNQFRDVPPTNEIVQVDGVTVLQFDSMGKIMRSKCMFDSNDVLRQMKATRAMMRMPNDMREGREL